MNRVSRLAPLALSAAALGLLTGCGPSTSAPAAALPPLDQPSSAVSQAALSDTTIKIALDRPAACHPPGKKTGDRICLVWVRYTNVSNDPVPVDTTITIVADASGAKAGRLIPLPGTTTLLTSLGAGASAVVEWRVTVTPTSTIKEVALDYGGVTVTAPLVFPTTNTADDIPTSKATHAVTPTHSVQQQPVTVQRAPVQRAPVHVPVVPAGGPVGSIG
jgi:hypothetical protein